MGTVDDGVDEDAGDEGVVMGAAFCAWAMELRHKPKTNPNSGNFTDWMNMLAPPRVVPIVICDYVILEAREFIECDSIHT